MSCDNKLANQGSAILFREWNISFTCHCKIVDYELDVFSATIRLLEATAALYKMLRFWLSILLFLANVETADAHQESPHCQWVCLEVSPSSLKEAQFGARFRINKLVDQNCANSRTVNSSALVEVEIVLASNERNPSEFSFLSFAAMFFSERVLYMLRQFLFGSRYKGRLGSDYINVSCALRPTLNESTRAAGNGLEALNSPLFYIRDNVSYIIQSTPFMGYVNVEGTFYLSAGFTNAEMTPEYSLKFDHSWPFTAFTILSTLFLIVYTLYSLYMLTMFCPNIKTVLVERLSQAAKVDEPENSSGSPTEHAELVTKVDVKPNDRVPTEHDHEEGNGGLDLSYDSIDSLGKDDRRCFQDSPGNEGYRSRQRRSTLFSTTEEHLDNIPVQTDQADNSSSDVGAANTGVNHREVKNKSVEVQVIDAEGAASPVGFRSFIANKIFSNSTSLSFRTLCVLVVRFVILTMFPLFIPMGIEVFVIMIPRSFICNSLPSLFLTKSVFFFLTENPGLLVCFAFHVLRNICFCFLHSSSTWVPSFLCRKHLECFIHNHYLFQLVFPDNSSPACDECKETPDCPKHCEIPVNIEHNHGCSLLEIFRKNWIDVFENLYQKYKQRLLQGNDGENPCSGRNFKFKIFLFLGSLGLFILWILLIVLDFIASLPTTSLCYGRVWFTVNWFENRCFQAIFLIIEFFVICLSIVGVVYFSFCCALSIEVALTSVFFTGMKYPVESLFCLGINIITVWHILWTCYSSFTNIYDDLVLKLFKACRKKKHASKFRQYKKEDTWYIPKKLFDSACDKLVPVKSSLKKLFIHLIVWVVFLFFVFSFITAGSTDIPDSKVLAATFAFLTVVHASTWDFLRTIGKKKDGKDVVRKGKVKDLVEDFFKGKLD